MGCTVTTTTSQSIKLSGQRYDHDDEPASLWTPWLTTIEPLRDACARTRTYLWMMVTLLGFCLRLDHRGVTSWVRAAFLDTDAYHSLLNLFHGTGIKLGKLTQTWIQIVTRWLPVHTVDNHRVLIADGLKVPKQGQRMPGVKSLYQSSENNSKPRYILGHHWQTIGALVNVGAKAICVPLASRLHEGIKRSPSDSATLLTKLVDLFTGITRILHKPAILVADAFYANREIVHPLLDKGHHLVSRVRSNAVAYQPPPPRPEDAGPGRPREYGAKIQLSDLFADTEAFEQANSPAYGEENVKIEYQVHDLLWKPHAIPVRFVLVDHPTRGRLILVTTKTDLDPLTVLELYAYRFKIEASFKQALHVVGAYAYRFWMKANKPSTQGDGDEYLHRATEAYREQVWAKVRAYELHVQLGLIAQGLLQGLAIQYKDRVWAQFTGWMRTMDTGAVPSEAVVAEALRSGLPGFLRGSRQGGTFREFLRERVVWQRLPGMVMGA